MVSSRSRSRDRGDRGDRTDRARYSTQQAVEPPARASGAVTGSSLFAELSKFKKGREIKLAKERQDSRPGIFYLIISLLSLIQGVLDKIPKLPASSIQANHRLDDNHKSMQRVLLRSLVYWANIYFQTPYSCLLALSQQ